MAQVFHRSFNTISRVTLGGAVLLVLGAGATVWGVIHAPYTTGQDVVHLQPVPFSHEHHAGLFGIDCRYCHTSVEDSSFAGIPPTKTCMNCHSQIWVGSEMLAPVRESYRTGKAIPWNRVHNLQEFVYFDHSIHINKGVGCFTCHGQVDRMPLMLQSASLLMEWCLECHRNPEPNLRPRSEVFNMAYRPPEDQATLGASLAKEYRVKRLTSCSTCHR